MNLIILNLLFMVFCICPSWSRDKAFLFEVVGTSRYKSQQILVDNFDEAYVEEDFKIGVALDLRHRDTDLGRMPISSHQLSVPHSYSHPSEKRLVKLGEGGSERRLSLILYRNRESAGTNCLTCCCGDPSSQEAVYSISTPISEKSLNRATVCVMFQGVKPGEPLFDVIIITEDDPEEALSKNSFAKREFLGFVKQGLGLGRNLLKGIRGGL